MAQRFFLYPIKFKLLIGLVCFFSIAEQGLAQQSSYSAITFAKEPKNIFSFTNKWDYPEGIIKHDDGKFEKTEGGKIEAVDTVHQYFTANCKTNVQGGYEIRYCYAQRKGETINVDFSDGLPAYASSFHLIIKRNQFSFYPEIIYPELNMSKNVVYKTTGSHLELFNRPYGDSKIESGYINITFEEIVPGKNKPTKFYLKGYFKTAIN
jgi:hypothetical protein